MNDEVDRGDLVFERSLRTDRISLWRWLLGAFGVGTYRQDDTVDIRYAVDGEMRVKHAAAITVIGDP
jgi:hypothetical protein